MHRESVRVYMTLVCFNSICRTLILCLLMTPECTRWQTIKTQIQSSGKTVEYFSTYKFKVTKVISMFCHILSNTRLIW